MLIVKKSKIPGAGKGLFTTSPIRKGDVIVEYKGEKMTWKQCLRRYGKHIDQAHYLYYVSHKNCIDAQYTPWALARYANDANGLVRVKGLKNNAEYDNIKKKPYIVATRDIPARSEIFVDYAGDYWKAMRDNLEAEEKERKRKGKKRRHRRKRRR